ncbi:MAG: hypothetical protein ACI8R0_003218 [Alteromonadales bacterium]|jgi:hypothetical protein
MSGVRAGWLTFERRVVFRQSALSQVMNVAMIGAGFIASEIEIVPVTKWRPIFTQSHWGFLLAVLGY